MSQFSKIIRLIWILFISLELSVFCSETSVKVALIHWNPSLGELHSNINNLNVLVEEAFKNNAQIVLTPELSLSGYSLTKEQALNLAIENPFSELAQMQNLASRYQGYVFVGAVEKTEENRLYNSVIMFGPTGSLMTNRKRGTAGWNDRGNLPVEVIHTPFGSIAVVVCSDTYLPDMSRIAAVKGADVLLVPANWWGNAGQEKIWRTRAIENGIWVMVNNRWGMEIDLRYSETYTYDMNDAASVVIDPSGKINLLYRKKDDDKATGDVILYSDIQINRTNAGAPSSQIYTLSMRNPAAYTSMRNDYYLKGAGNKIIEDLPISGKSNIAIANFSPEAAPENNIKKIENLIKGSTKTIDALVLPALAVTVTLTKFGMEKSFDDDIWYRLKEIVVINKVGLLLTTINLDLGEGDKEEALIYFLSDGSYDIVRNIHRSSGEAGLVKESKILDLPHARIGILSTVDALFPETHTSLAKRGVDIILISSDYERTNKFILDSGYILPQLHKECFLDLLMVATHHGFHLAIADSNGSSMLVEDHGGYTLKTHLFSENKLFEIEVDSESERFKNLNDYYPFDLDDLLSFIIHIELTDSMGIQALFTHVA